MDIFFNSWDSVLRVFITVIFSYPGLIILLRLYGKRSLAKLNVFDFIITVALGSTFASVVILQNVTIFDGIIAFILLLSAQYIITWTSIHWSFVPQLIKAEPTLLFRKGEFILDAMRAVRVTKSEVLAEVRQNGIACLDNVYAVVLETNGTMSVLAQTDQINNPTLVDINNYVPDVEFMNG